MAQGEGKLVTLGSGLLGQLLHEALSRLASPETIERILAEALNDAGLSALPRDRAAFGSFACGPLRTAVGAALGEEAAHAIIVDLGPAFTVQGDGFVSGVRRRERHSLAPPREGAPVVLVASGAPAHVDDLVPALRDKAKVVAAYDVFALLQAAQKYLGSALTLLLNDEMTGIRSSTLTTLGRMLPEGTRVILWGKAGVLPEASESSGIEWLCLGDEPDLSVIANLCLSILPEAQEPAAASAPAEPPRVLVAHGDASWRARVVRVLADAGYEPLSAPDGFMALERCIDEMPRAVIAAAGMPTLDGTQLASVLRGRFADAGPAVILVADAPIEVPLEGVTSTLGDGGTADSLLDALHAAIGPGAIPD